MAEATFRAGGIVSGLDTNFLVDQLTKLESIPLDRLRSRQDAFRRQVSAIGDLTSKLDAVKSAAAKLAADGGLGVKSTTTNTAFSVTPGTSAAAGQYEVQVTNLATNARALSGSVAPEAEIRSGTLTVGIEGTNYDITINEGDDLATVAAAIKDSGAPVSAVVLNDGTNDFLSVVRKDSGYTVGSSAAAALTLTANQTGGSGTNLSFTVTQPENATFVINDLPFTRTSNTVTDAVPGTTLNLIEEGGASEKLVLENDTTKTAANLKAFVDAYNSVMSAVSSNLKPSAGTDRSRTLAGDGSLRSLQQGMQGLLTSVVGGLGGVRTLADLGLKTSQADGTLTIDNTTLERALSSDATAINEIFSTATSGVSDLVDELVDRFTDPLDGVLTARKKGIDAQVRGLDTQLDSMQLRIDAFREALVTQFTAMEKIVAGLKVTGSYLSSQGG